ncbi:hypothetical protein [Tsukamurella sp. 1534]|uniref:hypothetical protein n=1 Tax=Tsukamurella sp. 1534 TaxID=1151061 RepID=UPI0002F8A63C|nr:hypothetical protein [Tsukamurella sp. 1534]
MTDLTQHHSTDTEPGAPRTTGQLVDATVGAILLVALVLVDALAVMAFGYAAGMASDPCTYQDCSSHGSFWPAVWTMGGLTLAGIVFALFWYFRAMGRRESTVLWPFAGFAFTIVGWMYGTALASPVFA